MNWQLSESNVVIIARQFNPSVVGQLWLVRNGIVSENDFEPGCVFTDVLVNVVTREFNLMVSPIQCQFSPKVPQERKAALVQEKVGAIVRLLPHTPFRALGLNFSWHLIPEEGSIDPIARRLFFSEGRPIYRLFDTPDARYGAYLSKQALGCRMKLDVKPLIAELPGREDFELLQFGFNFHFDLEDENTTEQIIEFLGIWDDAFNEARHVLIDTEIGGEP